MWILLLQNTRFICFSISNRDNYSHGHFIFKAVKNDDLTSKSGPNSEPTPISEDDDSLALRFLLEVDFAVFELLPV
jgi:hypothetical protein